MSYLNESQFTSLKETLHTNLCRENLMYFAQAINPQIVAYRHTVFIANKIQQWLTGTLPSGKKNMMLFVPPQHGKSELFSRMAIPFALGLNPNAKIIFATYNDTFAKKFNRQIQRNIDNETYHKIFPETTLNARNVVSSAKGKYVRNAKEFEIIGKKGGLLVVGVNAGATGNPADFFFIDDYIKDATQANSNTFHNSTWEWYNNVVETRLHNHSRIGLTFTRWSDKDIAARLLEIDADNWEVIVLPAIREDYNNSEDWREIGEALCPEMHNKEKILRQKRNSETTFAALYQQRPAPLGGGEIKSQWFRRVKLSDLQQNPQFKHCTKIVYIDTAEGRNDSDYTAIATCYFIPVIQHNEITDKKETVYQVYVRNISREKVLIGDAYAYVDKVISRFVPTKKAKVKIEQRSLGAAYISGLEQKYGYDTMPYNFPKDSGLTGTSAKVDKIKYWVNFLVDGNVFLIEEDNEVNNHWISELLLEAEAFPKGRHDDQLDTLTMACVDAMFDNIYDRNRDFRRYF